MADRAGDRLRTVSDMMRALVLRVPLHRLRDDAQRPWPVFPLRLFFAREVRDRFFSFARSAKAAKESTTGYWLIVAGCSESEKNLFLAILAWRALRAWREILSFLRKVGQSTNHAAG